MSDSDKAQPVRPASIWAEAAELFEYWVKSWTPRKTVPDYNAELPDQSEEAAWFAARNFTVNLHEALAAWSKGEEYPPAAETETEGEPF